MYFQKWARAYRDDIYHGAINTNNGAEAMNKLLKYKFLPRQKNLTLSFLVIKLIEEFIPALHYKYVFQNFKQTSLYRAYNPVVVPKYLQCRPKSVILHCLHRKSKSLKYTGSDVNEVDASIGIFEVKGKSQNYTVDFSIPACTCKDWIAHHIPCKHFFVIFNLKESWDWDKLPELYLNSAHLNIDSDAVTSHLKPKTVPEPAEESDYYSEPTLLDTAETMETGEEPECTTTELFSELPSSKVIVCINIAFGFSWQCYIKYGV